MCKEWHNPYNIFGVGLWFRITVLFDLCHCAIFRIVLHFFSLFCEQKNKLDNNLIRIKGVKVIQWKFIILPSGQFDEMQIVMQITSIITRDRVQHRLNILPVITNHIETNWSKQHIIYRFCTPTPSPLRFASRYILIASVTNNTQQGEHNHVDTRLQ